MFCYKCGKEIPDDSEFCYSCGSKVEIKKDTISDTPHSVVNNTTIESQDTTRETSNQTILSPSSEKKSNLTSSNQVEEKKKKITFGLVVLLSFYGHFISQLTKNNNTEFSIITTIVMILCFPLVIILYFNSRNILLKRKYFIDNVWLSSFVSGFLSLIVVSSVIGFSTGIDESIQRRNKIKGITEFSNHFKKQIEVLKTQEVEYSKMLSSEPKTQSEINDRILKIDEYKKYLMKKNTFFMTLINFFRETNSKYKKDKSVDEQINKLELLIRDGLKSSIDSLDLYKKYFITGDEKYYNQFQEESEKIQLSRDEVTQLMTNIGKSL